MPRPVPFPVRQLIFRRLQQGADVSAIAAELNLPVRTVRHLARRFRANGADLSPGYRRGEQSATSDTSPWMSRVLAMRAEHADWGAGLIRVLLQDEAPSATVPSERTLRRWLSRQGGEPAPPGRRPATHADRARQPHDVWQMDAADQKRLQTGQPISWLRAVDECSGAVLSTVVFSRGKLQSGSAAARAGRAARLVRAVGLAAAVPGRQWFAVGFLGRLAAPIWRCGFWAWASTCIGTGPASRRRTA